MSKQKGGQAGTCPRTSASAIHQQGDHDESPGGLSILGRAALGYAGKGFRVLPCEPRGKGPLLSKKQGGKGVHDATTDEGTIVGWWQRYPDANIGLMAPEGMAFLDVDPRNGGTDDDLPETLVQQSGGDGWHRLYKDVPARLPGKLREGVDIKAHGKGYVLADPSIHPSGKTYRWVGGFHPEDITSFPVELVIFGTDAKKKTNGAERVWTDHQLTEALKLIKADSYDDWIRVGMALRSVYGDDEFPRWVEWSRSSDRFHSEEDCWNHWKTFNRRDIGLGTIGHLLTEQGLKIPSEAPEEAFDVPLDEVKEERKTLKFVIAQNVVEERIKWLQPGYLIHGVLHCIAGYGGEGKSSIMSALIAGITTGKNFLTGDPVETASIAMITEEPFAFQTRPRLRLAGANLNRVMLVEGVYMPKGVEPWNLVDHMKRTREFLGDHPNMHLLIDPVGSYMSSSRREINTWKDSDVRSVLDPWRRLAEELKRAVIFLAHYSKGNADRAMNKVMGSGAFVTTARCSYGVVQPPRGFLDEYGYNELEDDTSAYRILFPNKTNIGPMPEPVVILLEYVEGEDNPKVSVSGKLPRIRAEDLLAMIKAKDSQRATPLQDRLLEAIQEDEGQSKQIIAKRTGSLATNNGTQKAFRSLETQGLIEVIKLKGQDLVFTTASALAKVFK
jgi:hypothetical protein